MHPLEYGRRFVYVAIRWSLLPRCKATAHTVPAVTSGCAHGVLVNEQAQEPDLTVPVVRPASQLPNMSAE